MNYKKIKSYEDACKALNVKPLSDEVFNAFPEAERENVKAYHQLTVITRAINEGWEPDFTNRNEAKYEPYMHTNFAGLAFAYTANAPSYAHTNFGSRLCFPDYERAAFAVKTFGNLYKAYFLPGKWEAATQEPAGAAGKEPENKEADGGGENTIREEDDMSNAPDFLKNVVAICKEHIEPLCEGEDKGIILIAVQDNIENEDGDTSFATTLAVHGKSKQLAKGLNRFMSNEKSQQIVEQAYRLAKIDTFIQKMKDFIDLL